MNTNKTIAGLFAGLLVLTPVVIGRFDGAYAGLLRVDVLLGIAVVSTLVALITLEYGSANERRLNRSLVREVGFVQPTTKIVQLADERAAA